VSVPQLTPTEERIVLMLAAGQTPREIALGVGLDERTVEWHLVRAARKLGAASTLHTQVLRAGGPGRGEVKESVP
jgi:DNA-binding CsgD family transcriptional regulator